MEGSHSQKQCKHANKPKKKRNIILIKPPVFQGMAEGVFKI